MPIRNINQICIFIQGKEGLFTVFGNQSGRYFALKQGFY